MGDIYVAAGAVVSADGAEPDEYSDDPLAKPSDLHGGGSGGSILVIADNFTSQGLLSVAGGSVYYRQGGAGGGGRISINVPSCTADFIVTVT